jgi:phenylpropionate dioxygenase-like ring-hydroxylating dioxygenase large terminal subunit
VLRPRRRLHFPFVHDGVLGSRDNPVTPEHEVVAGEREHHFVLFMASSPLGRRSTRSFTFIARNYQTDPEQDDEFVQMQETILEQDRPVVEAQRPEELPVDLSAELHIRGPDRASVLYRKWLVEVVRASSIAPSTPARSPSAGATMKASSPSPSSGAAT